MNASQLLSVQPQDWPVAPDWRELVDGFFASTTGQRLLAFLRERLERGATIFPPQPLRALELTPLSRVRVVILGQDPYHGRGQAEGLAFSVPPGVPIPPSLRNIFQELQRDLGEPVPAFPNPGGSLLRWARHGVLLLNTCLTVEEGAPASHSGKGWEALTDAVIREVSQQASAVVFMLWGSHAQGKRPLIDASRHLVLCANHPSPLSAHRPPIPFLGCGHFSQARDWRLQHNQDAVTPVPPPSS
ncbi:uracil-DNA glycosylase [Candidatus Symbiobacter mobilis]|uniref:Uracil-DNA glycosylase n=1 Tax=Candidatus Symbiobacter mobilis CR TaxID=946483 RepID=U5NA66_9BURK|nr:uracil-DNA glycosylase [Candidatus Symbiobacter mobilis]AGX87143.1 uracil-DNA glycosylase [Candidatus Symbiobacter mobilis CR]